MTAGRNPLTRLLDNKWTSRAGNLSFLIGLLWSALKFTQGNSVNVLALILLALGIVLMGVQFLPQGPEFAADFSEANVFVGSKAKMKLGDKFVPIGFRLVGLPLFNCSKSLNANARDITAVVAVFKPPGKVILDRAHGLWRELEESHLGADKAPKTGIARSIDLPPNRERHILTVLVQPLIDNQPMPYWLIARDPLEVSNSGFKLPAGEYLLSVTLRSPDLRKPTRLTYDLVLPNPRHLGGEREEPLLVEHQKPQPDWLETQ